jgi:hypothetical protein
MRTLMTEVMKHYRENADSSSTVMKDKWTSRMRFEGIKLNILFFFCGLGFGFVQVLWNSPKEDAALPSSHSIPRGELYCRSIVNDYVDRIYDYFIHVLPLCE